MAASVREDQRRGGRVAPRRRGVRLSRRGRLVRTAGLVLLSVGVYLGVTLGQALAAPGTDSMAARVAEWGRNHGMGFIVTSLEQLQYRLNPPKVGGTPNTALLREAKAAAAPSAAGSTSADASKLPHVSIPPVTLHAPLTPVVSPALPGEGAFHSVVTVKGQPAIQVAYLRPDSVHTSYLAGVAWMSSRLLSFVQHPGFQDPGHLNLWSQPDWLPPSQRTGLVATFNSGFKLADAQGGYYDNGHTLGTLRPGAATFVIYKDGHVAIGSWGSEVSMTPQVVSARQNLKLLIDHGQLSPTLSTNVESNWGATLKGAYYIWRSGVGVTSSGDIVYVTGDALSVKSLAVLLQRAGAVQAMEMDINPAWISYMWYAPTNTSAKVAPTKILPFARPADRYLTQTSRDFVAVYAR